jgi:hypothetical protein
MIWAGVRRRYCAALLVCSVLAGCASPPGARQESGDQAPAPAPPPASLRFTSLSAGTNHVCGIATNGAAWCWGINRAGQLGNGATGGASATPVAVAGSVKFVAVSAGFERTCALTADGAAWCWGLSVQRPLRNNATQLGDSVPVAIAGGVRFAMLSVGRTHACGVSIDGMVYCWGDNYLGKQGNGSTLGYGPTPTLVPGGLHFATVSAANGFTCGLSSDGTAYCWGDNEFGKLGNGATSGFSMVPGAVNGGLRFSALTSGLFRSCGITTSGATYCWGAGTGAPVQETRLQDYGPAPVAISGELTFTSVSAGSSVTCGAAGPGAARCWGGNYVSAMAAANPQAVPGGGATPPQRSGASPPVTAGVGEQTYFEFQVSKHVTLLPGQPVPRYPDSLLVHRITGEVLASFVVDTMGIADMSTFTVLKSTHDLFTEAVRAVLPAQRFSPAEVGGRKVRQLVQQPFTFYVAP